MLLYAKLYPLYISMKIFLECHKEIDASYAKILDIESVYTSLQNSDSEEAKEYFISAIQTEMESITFINEKFSSVLSPLETHNSLIVAIRGKLIESYFKKHTQYFATIQTIEYKYNIIF